MSTAYRVFARVDIFLKACEIVFLEEVHGLTVKLLDSLPNLSCMLIVVGEIKFLTPVAEVGREDKQSARFIEVRRKNFPIIFSHFLINWACENGNYFHIPAKSFHDERQVHLDAVLVLIIVNIEHVEPLFGFQLIHYLGVNVQRAKGSAILI